MVPAERTWAPAAVVAAVPLAGALAAEAKAKAPPPVLHPAAGPTAGTSGWGSRPLLASSPRSSGNRVGNSTVGVGGSVGDCRVGSASASTFAAAGGGSAGAVSSGTNHASGSTSHSPAPAAGELAATRRISAPLVVRPDVNSRSSWAADEGQTIATSATSRRTWACRLAETPVLPLAGPAVLTTGLVSPIDERAVSLWPSHTVRARAATASAAMTARTRLPPRVGLGCAFRGMLGGVFPRLTNRPPVLHDERLSNR